MYFWESMTMLLDGLPDLYMIFQEGLLVYSNPPAKAILGDKKEMREILGSSLPETESGVLPDSRLGDLKGLLEFYPLHTDAEKALLVRFQPESAGEAGAMQELLCNLGGQLRESMAIISMSLDILTPRIESQGSDSFNNYLAMLHQHQRRIQRLAGNVGSFCLLTQGQMHLEFEKFNLVDLCATLCDQVADLQENQRRHIRFHCKHSALYVLGDSEKIKRMLLNLISNSMKYTEKTGRIQLELHPEAEWLRLSVTDNGTGMTPEVLGRIFRSFERPYGLPLDQGRGLGLGLFIANGIARLHGGTLVVESKAGQGTRVTVTLRKSPTEELSLREEIRPYGPAAQRVLLTELADTLGYQDYLPQLLD